MPIHEKEKEKEKAKAAPVEDVATSGIPEGAVIEPDTTGFIYDEAGAPIYDVDKGQFVRDQKEADELLAKRAKALESAPKDYALDEQYAEDLAKLNAKYAEKKAALIS